MVFHSELLYFQENHNLGLRTPNEPKKKKTDTCRHNIQSSSNKLHAGNEPSGWAKSWKSRS